MFYIDQLCTLSFPIGLVKTESGFINLVVKVNCHLEVAVALMQLNPIHKKML